MAPYVRSSALVALLVLGLAACGGPSTNGRIITSRTGAPVVLTPDSTAPTPALTPLAPKPTLLPTATWDPRTPTPDAGAFSRVVYSYTAGIQHFRLVLEIAGDGYAQSHTGTLTRVGYLSADAMAKIRAALRATDFFTLQDEYRPNSLCCDQSLYEITVVMPDGRSKTVMVSGRVPDEVLPVIDALAGLWKTLPAPTPTP